ncbi:ABC-type cobalt transport system, permease component CbiQ [Methanoculleus chikugoensis]|uniref:ABC-type cobalt transport system, permease component CbiQ n=1 Tax=Methanoculleus chikugoensis TaxID=118126 RepID=A0A1M4MLE7_9EURY|nr:energy-coupling factor transporter transmembrane component T [Methanoculleus chikugoensis]MDD4567109.1 energy-coupling factor transporter transmembrane component T [Methanoculleus chikugoensis]SCL75761.1 ABC-type cobalt transport system, permease component CbiQ [Methanoculleus chikugoensis]
MQDPRLRLLSVAVLSLAAFASTVGAAAALVWWLLFTPRTGSLPRPGVLLPLVGMVAATALVSAWGGGAGLSYFFRMTVILLLAAWAYTETEDGEVLAVAVWALGNRVGFEVGLVAEMGISGISVLRQEIEQVRTAMALKGIRPGVRSIVPLAVTLIVTEIRRADETARLLVVRGYTTGGKICPRFRTDPLDVPATIMAIMPAFLSALPLRDVFILVG